MRTGRKMLVQKDETFKEACETLFRLNQDDKVRYWCEAFEEQERFERSLEHSYKKYIAEQEAVIAERDSAIAEKDSVIAEKDSAIAQQKAENERLLAKIEELKRFYRF